MSYTIRLDSLEHARAACVEYLGSQEKYLGFVCKVAELLEGRRITTQYRHAAFACNMVGMRGYLITRVVFLDARKLIDDSNESAPN